MSRHNFFLPTIIILSVSTTHIHGDCGKERERERHTGIGKYHLNMSKMSLIGIQLINSKIDRCIDKAGKHDMNILIKKKLATGMNSNGRE